MRYYEIRDPVYGFIRFNELEKDIINHPVFQRLRRIKQLALTEMVYPSATHTRFEHSLGVMHLASQFYDRIVSENKNYLETKLHYNEAGFRRDRQLVRLGALLHDIGHTPFSHVGEDKKLMKENPETNKPYKHEHYSVEIIKNKLGDIIKNHDINQNYRISADEIAGLIEGNEEVLGRKIFWKQLISGQLDADRCDYLLRDPHHSHNNYCRKS